MRAKEFLIEESVVSDRFVDGRLKFTYHVKQRSDQRGIPMAEIVQALKRLETLRGKDLRQLPPTSFVVKTPMGFEMAMVKSQDLDTKKIDYTLTTVRNRLKTGAGQRVVYLESELNDQPLRMAKIEKTGQVVQILRHEDNVKFSDEPGWFLINTEPGKRTGTGIRWIPDSTRFTWVKDFENLKEYTTIKSQRASRGGIDLEARKDGLRFQINATAHGRELGRVVFDVQFQGKDTILVAQDLMIHPEYRGQGIAAIMYDYAKELGYVVERSPEQTDAGRAFWDKNRGPDSKVWEQAGSKQATAKQVLAYINKTHHEPMTDKLANAVLAHPQWELVQVPLLNLNIPDQEYDDVDYNEYEPESDPYGRVMTVEPEHAGEVSTHLVDRKPIVIDSDRYIIDGNHRAWAAKYLLNRDYIHAWRPVT